jgi:hypothetical protein
MTKVRRVREGRASSANMEAQYRLNLPTVCVWLRGTQPLVAMLSLFRHHDARNAGEQRCLCFWCKMHDVN